MITTLAMKAELAVGSLLVPAKEIPNPIENTTPDFNAFGAKGNGAMLGIIAAGWGVGLLICIGFLIFGIVKYGAARRNSNVDDMGSGAAQMKASGLSFGGLAMLGVIVGAILKFAGQF